MFSLTWIAYMQIYRNKRKRLPRKEFNSLRTGLGNQYGRHDVMWKHSISESIRFIGLNPLSTLWSLHSVVVFSVASTLHLNEISKFLGISAQEMFMKTLQCLRKKVQKSECKNGTRSLVFAVHHLYHYGTEDLLARIGLIWSYIATTLTLNRS